MMIRSKALLMIGLGAFAVVTGYAHAQQLQAGIHVELPQVGYAVPMPDADRGTALIITVTEDGSVYFGSDPICPAEVARKVHFREAADAEAWVFIKADEKTSYSAVQKVTAALRDAGTRRAAFLVSAKIAASGPNVPPAGLDLRFSNQAKSVPAQLVSSATATPFVVIDQRKLLLHDLPEHLLPDEIVVLDADGEMSFGEVAQAIAEFRSAGAEVILK